MDNSELFKAMLSPEFQRIIGDDPVLEALEQEKFNERDEYFELMMALSRVFTIDGVVVSCITPAAWAYLYSIGNAYAAGGTVREADTDIMLYVLHNGVGSIDAKLAERAAGFCASHGMDYASAEKDLRTMVYLSFRPLEMLGGGSPGGERARFSLDWLTHVVSVVSPLAGLTAHQVMYDTSLTECFYYLIQKARQGDAKDEIRRRNSGEINEAIWLRTMELGREFAARAVDETAKSEDNDR